MEVDVFASPRKSAAEVDVLTGVPPLIGVNVPDEAANKYCEISEGKVELAFKVTVPDVQSDCGVAEATGFCGVFPTLTWAAAVAVQPLLSVPVTV